MALEQCFDGLKEPLGFECAFFLHQLDLINHYNKEGLMKMHLALFTILVSLNSFGYVKVNPYTVINYQFSEMVTEDASAEDLLVKCQASLVAEQARLTAAGDYVFPVTDCTIRISQDSQKNIQLVSGSLSAIHEL